MHIEPMHAARLALLEGALLSLLREASDSDEPNDLPDGVTVTLDGHGLSIDYTRGGMPVAGEGL